jgi:FMN phosphatase YigB (HAD superfamily)
MKKIGYLAVDLGNVILNVNFTQFMSHLSKTLNVSIEDVWYFLNRTQKLHDLGLTQISDELRDHFKIKSSVIVDDLVASWNETISACPTMVNWLKEIVKNKNVAILSNIGTEHLVLVKNILTNEIFDNTVHFFSCEVGSRKPSLLYYKTFLDMYPDFKGCVYLDDRIENIESGNKFGLNSQHFVLDSYKTEQEIEEKLKEIEKLF